LTGRGEALLRHAHFVGLFRVLPWLRPGRVAVTVPARRLRSGELPEGSPVRWLRSSAGLGPPVPERLQRRTPGVRRSQEPVWICSLRPM